MGASFFAAGIATFKSLRRRFRLTYLQFPQQALAHVVKRKSRHGNPGQQLSFP